MPRRNAQGRFVKGGGGKSRGRSRGRSSTPHRRTPKTRSIALVDEGAPIGIVFGIARPPQQGWGWNIDPRSSTGSISAKLYNMKQAILGAKPGHRGR